MINNPSKKRNARLVIRQFIAVASIGMMAACDYSDQLATFRVPASNVTVSIQRTPTHLFLAEYERAVLIEADGRLAMRRQMHGDTGGYSRTNLYRLTDAVFLVRDADASYAIDVVRRTISQDEHRRAGGSFVGSFDVDESGLWRFISASERTELRTDFLQGGQFVESPDDAPPDLKEK